MGIRAIPRNIINGLNGLDEDIQGAYYFYNPARDLFLTAGNKWGTQASVGTTGLDLTIQSVGQYFLIDSRVSNGSTNHYFGLDGNKALYLDSPPAYWTIAPGKLTIDGRSTYTFATSDIGYMAAPTTGTVLTTVSDPDDEYAQWMLVTREDLVAKMNDASENNPVDADFLLPGYNFSRNDQRNGTWNGNPTVGGDAVNCCGEKFNTTFDVWQQLENIPNGEYRLTMQGFYRCGGYRDAASLRTSGREELNAILYFGDQTCPLPSIFDEAGQCGTTGVETTHGYIPNTMTESSAYLNEGCYAVGPLTTFVTDGTLRLGISKTVSVEADWALFDNFHLMYYGGYATEIHSPEAPTDENRRKGVYDLQGRRIADDSSFFIHHSSFPKGLYIVDGKKVLLK